MSHRRHIPGCSTAVLVSAMFLLSGCVSDVPKQVDVFCWAEDEGLIRPDDKWDSKWGDKYDPEADVICTPVSGKAAATTGGDGTSPPNVPATPGVPSTPPSNPPTPTVVSGGGANGDGHVSATGDGWTVVSGGGAVTITQTP